MNEQMSASWRKLVGSALLWVALTALIRMTQEPGASLGIVAPLLSFACFAAGLLLFADGIKRSISADLRNQRAYGGAA